MKKGQMRSEAEARREMERDKEIGRKGRKEEKIRG